jgi:hypothetical protein|tara:strand:- start:1902 stop:2210 length:309 start_codon:yes stop_codon:yes gene_type:complete
MKNDELTHIEGVAALEHQHHDTTNEIKQQCVFINWQGWLNIILIATVLFCGYNWNKRVLEASQTTNHEELSEKIAELEQYLIRLNESVARIKESPPDTNGGQ